MSRIFPSDPSETPTIRHAHYYYSDFQPEIWLKEVKINMSEIFMIELNTFKGTIFNKYTSHW